MFHCLPNEMVCWPERWMEGIDSSIVKSKYFIVTFFSIYEDKTIFLYLSMCFVGFEICLCKLIRALVVKSQPLQPISFLPMSTGVISNFKGSKF